MLPRRRISDLRTYVQSVNVLFTADRVAGPELETLLERMFELRSDHPKSPENLPA